MAVAVPESEPVNQLTNALIFAPLDKRKQLQLSSILRSQQSRLLTPERHHQKLSHAVRRDRTSWQNRIGRIGSGKLLPLTDGFFRVEG